MNKRKILTAIVALSLGLSIGAFGNFTTSNKTTKKNTLLLTEQGHWTQTAGHWKYYSSNGNYINSGWKFINGYWYYFNNSEAVTGVYNVNGTNYVFNHEC